MGSGALLRTEYGHYLGLRRGWAVVNAQPRREQVALENLERQDFRAYCPQIWRQRGRGRRAAAALQPLFPGYLFVRVDPDGHRWRPILSTYGVRRVMLCGDRLSVIHDEFIDSLRAREVDGAIVRPASPYRVGQEVRVAGGPFDGLVATIVEMGEKDRLTVLMRLLSRTVKVMLDEQQLSPV
jgi:transcriptional antiterminator RfaH